MTAAQAEDISLSHELAFQEMLYARGSPTGSNCKQGLFKMWLVTCNLKYSPVIGHFPNFSAPCSITPGRASGIK